MIVINWTKQNIIASSGWRFTIYVDTDNKYYICGVYQICDQIIRNGDLSMHDK